MKTQATRVKYAALVFSFAILCSSCSEKIRSNKTYYVNGYEISIVTNDSVRMEIDDSVVFIFETGFLHDTITISQRGNVAAQKIISTDTFFAFADHFRVKRNRTYNLKIDEVAVDVVFPDNIKVVFVKKDRINRKLNFLLSNESHYYQ